MVPPTSVNGSASVLELKLVVAKGDLAQFNFPVGLSAHGGVHKFALEGGLVNTTKGSLSSVFLRPSHTESEHWLVKEALFYKVIKWRDDVADSNGVIGKAKDTIESRYHVSTRGSEGPKGATHFPKANARPGSLVASAKSMPFTVRSPMLKTSLETKPSIEPEP
jgi:hypothetical protein